MLISEKQAEIIGHSLGVNVFHAKLSKKKKDKKLPETFYRNRFCASDGHSDMPILFELEKIGCIEQAGKINNGQSTIWCVTELGVSKFRKWFTAYV